MARLAVPVILSSMSVDCAMLKSGSTSGALASEWESEVQAASNPNAIQRVLKLLEEMQAQIQKEGKEDTEAYDKMTCWCTTTKDEKTQAVEDAEEKIDQLVSDVEGGASSDASLKVKVEALKKDIAEKTSALKTAVSIREKEAAEFRAEEKDSVQAIVGLKNALNVIQRSAGLLQTNAALRDSILSTVRSVSVKHEKMMLESHDAIPFAGTPFFAKRGTSMLQLTTAALAGFDGEVSQALRGGRAPAGEVPPEFALKVLQRAASAGTSFAQQPARPAGAGQAYSSQSGAITGILKQMLEDFESNLAVTQKDEMAAAEQFKELQAASEKEIAASKATLDEMELENSAAIKGLSDAKEDLEATRLQRSADVEFLRNLELECKGLDREYAERMKMRNTEISAVTETMSILTSDESRDLFSKQIGGASFLQLSVSRSSSLSARAKAAKVLMETARHIDTAPSFDDIVRAWDDSRSGPKPQKQLAAIAMKVRLDGFDSIKKACDNMIADLKRQQADEVKTKSSCDSNMHTNDKDIYAANETLKDTQDDIEDLETQISELTDAIAEAQEDVSNTQISIKAQGLVRQEENKVFQEEVNDQRAIQLILGKAIDRMAQVYRASLLQTAQAANPASSPVKFAPTKKNAGGSPVIAMMESVVEDSKALEAEAMTAETGAQQAYATFVNDASKSMDELKDAIEQKTGLLATAKANKESAESQAESVTNRLEDLSDYRYDLHQECDYVMKNFDKRQEARLQEIEAIQKAVGYLSGMK